LSAKAGRPQGRARLAQRLRTTGTQMDMSRRQAIAARISVSSLALGLALAAWAFASVLLSRL